MKRTYLITTDPDKETPRTVWYFKSDPQEADRKVLTLAKNDVETYSLWQLCCHANLVSTEILLSKDGEDRPRKK